MKLVLLPDLDLIFLLLNIGARWKVMVKKCPPSIAGYGNEFFTERLTYLLEYYRKRVQNDMELEPESDAAPSSAP